MRDPENILKTRFLRSSFLAVCVTGFLALFWFQALDVPYWQDDYYFLLKAKQAHLAGAPWYAAFFPETKVLFWRPLGMESYWRFVEGVLGGSPRAAHVVNILLLILSALAVGWFVATLVRLLDPERDGSTAGWLAALLYGVHSAHFLPVAWAAAANDSIAIFFSALALRFWLVVTTTGGRRGVLAAPAVVLCLVLALLSRDIAFVLPPLGLLLTFWLKSRSRPSRTAWGVGALCIGIALAWLLIRNQVTLQADPAYDLRLGFNVLRNTFALILFAFNTPFEALRFFFFVKPSVGTALWGIVPFLLQMAAFGLLLSAAWKQLGRKGAGILAVFFVFGCAPFFLLSVNCYPYYTSLGLFAYAVIAGLAASRTRILQAVLVLALLSSAIATLGNFFLDSPSHIGRARWSERQLVRLEAFRDIRPELFAQPLTVVVEDEHRYQGFRAEGIAYRLGIDPDAIQVVEPDNPRIDKRTVLVVPHQGDVYFRVTGDGSKSP